MTIEENNILVDIAKSKKDGVYLKKPYTYVVKQGKFVAYADMIGKIWRCYPGFNTCIGSCRRSEIRVKLNELIKNI